MCLCGCTHVCLCVVGLCESALEGGEWGSGMASGVGAQAWPQVLPSFVSLIANLAVLTGYKSQKSSCLHFPLLKLQAHIMFGFLHGCSRSKLRFSCLFGKNFTDWAILKFIIVVDFGSVADLIKFDAFVVLQSHFNMIGIYSNKCFLKFLNF